MDQILLKYGQSTKYAIILDDDRTIFSMLGFTTLSQACEKIKDRIDKIIIDPQESTRVEFSLNRK